VTWFTRDTTSGALGFGGSAKNGVAGVEGLGGAYSVTVSPDGRHVYAAGLNDDSIVVLSRDAATGALTFASRVRDGVAGVDGLDAATAVAVSPDGHHVYATGFSDNAVAVFARNAETGALGFVERKRDDEAGITRMAGPSYVAVSADDRSVLVSASADNTANVFRRDPASGRLSLVQIEQDGQGGILVEPLGVLAGAVAVVAIGSHSYFVGTRFSQTTDDLNYRLWHWSTGLSLLEGPLDWGVGKGLGRFPGTYFWKSAGTDIPGAHTFAVEHGNRYLRLAGPKGRVGVGEEYRISQRVDAHPGESLLVTLRTRAAGAVGMAVYLCQQHLIYAGPCVATGLQVGKTPGEWEEQRIPLEGSLPRGPWYAPRLQFFSIIGGGQGQSLEIDDVMLLGGDGRDLLRNGRFSTSATHWFFASDRHHRPWHVKNLWLNYLFDQGWFGLLTFAALYVAALVRVTFGPAARHPMAPYIAAGLAGFGIVGMFDSLVDVARLATLFFLVIVAALLCRATAVDGRAQTPLKARSSRTGVGQSG